MSNLDIKSKDIPMSDKVLRYIIASVITLLLIFQIGTSISSLFGLVWGALAAGAVMIVSFFSARLARAGGKSSFWFLLPTLLFTVLPIAFTVWKVITEDVSWLQRIIGLAPFIIGFAAPILLLLVAYFVLRRRVSND
jgi:hypothetical protein